jgi:predicted HicB family RNase H-like nuclease
MNLMRVDGYHAKMEYNEETDQFRGDDSWDFWCCGLLWIKPPDELRREFKKSLDVFLEGLQGARSRAT